MDVGLGIGDIALNDGFKNEISKQYGAEGENFIENWQKVSMVWGVGRIAQAALNGKLAISVNKAKQALKGFRNSKNFGTLEQETKNFIEQADNKLLEAEGKIKIQDKDGSYAEFETNVDEILDGIRALFSHCGCASKIDDFLLLKIHEKLSASEIAKLDLDFAGDINLLHAMNNDQELLDIWKFYKTDILDILKTVKKLKYAKQNYKVTDGVAFEDDLEKILIDLKVTYSRGRKVLPNTIDNGGELDFELNNLLIEQTIGEGSKFAQLKKYIANPTEYNPKNNPIVLFGPRYTNSNMVRDIQTLQAGGLTVRVVNNFEDLLILLR